ncbi:MAG: PQQ-dependent sugar dehydrogenase [Planctomycetota bacterium]|nr:PQQ-dependent sugar dehydrogenase [Planctomycetota bacterium]
MKPFAVSSLVLLLIANGILAQGPSDASKAPLPDGTKAALQSIQGLRIPKGYEVQLFAAEPQLASPVAFCLDERNRVFVAEEYRFNLGTEENRTRPFLLEDDLQLQTVDDRLKMFRKFADRFDGGMDWFSRTSDQVRLLEDRDGDGRADSSTVFAGGFNAPLDGLAAGVIARDGDVYFTCIPHLWLLQDKDGDGKAEIRKSLHRGFGVNAAFLGHDLHGLVWGPDGRLYFSVGDRGVHVKTPEGTTIHAPRTGCVFRCFPDGSELEMIYTGLRNPQELAFDQFGNLFAVDNNCDKGDHSRLVYIVKGGSSGWNMAYQSIPAPYLTGPWHAEKTWHLQNDEQPQSILPPVGAIGAGPSGFTFSSGVGWEPRYKNKFFYCNYTSRGGIEAFGVEQHGASFKMVDYHDFLKPIPGPTDVDFGYDGKMYFTDFVGLNWNGGSQGGRVYTIVKPATLQDATVQDVKRLFASGYGKLDTDRLLELLDHEDMRVRQRSQYELAKRDASAGLARKLHDVKNTRFGRLHALWALGQIAHRRPLVLRGLENSLTDADEQIRAHAARIYGEEWGRLGNRITVNALQKRADKSLPTAVELQAVGNQLVRMLDDPSLRVRMFAALDLWRFNLPPIEMLNALFTMLRDNQDRDRFVRHAAVQCLQYGIWPMRYGVDDPDRSVRIAALLALRGLKDPWLRHFLKDSDLGIATEAARAINDLPLNDTTDELAKQIDAVEVASQPFPESFLRRIINANYRLGGPPHILAVARLSTNARLPSAIRAEALSALKDWADESKRDRVTGFWRPTEKRNPARVRNALESRVSELLARNSGELATPTTDLIAKYGITVNLDDFDRRCRDQSLPVESRMAGLQLLVQRKYDGIGELLEASLTDAAPLIRAEARRLIALQDAVRGLALVQQTLADASAAMIEKQAAVATIAQTNHPLADKQLAVLGQQLVESKLPGELRLDVLEALQSKKSVLADQFRKLQQPGDPLAAFRVATQGGDPKRGQELFLGHRTAQCIRCHKIGGPRLTAGPDLAQVGHKNTPEDLLESLIVPDAKIAKGFGSNAFVLTNGKVVVGIEKSSGVDFVEIETSDGKRRRLLKDEIDERSPPKSAMPTVRKTLSLRELRDIIAFLATLKSADPEPIKPM